MTTPRQAFPANGLPGQVGLTDKESAGQAPPYNINTPTANLALPKNAPFAGWTPPGNAKNSTKNFVELERIFSYFAGV
jgi:hypothetical protein